MDHALLPSITNAQLPAAYEKAKVALSDCTSLDECKDWSDKAAALASYARQSQDDSMLKMATRIQGRAIRRAGELLKQIDAAQGSRTDIEPRAVGGPRLTRKQAAEDAGLSDRQRKNALRVATIPDDRFNDLVDSDKPPTITKLADIGTKKKGTPLVDLKGRCPKEFNKALHFVGDFEHVARGINGYDIDALIPILNDSERARLRKAIQTIEIIHDRIMTRI